MNILFTADIHIKLGQKNVPVEWAKNRFQLFTEQFKKMQQHADLVVLGGDIFDRLPTMDEVELYFDLISSIDVECIVYPGNHEMLKKDTTFLSYLKRATIRINPLVTIVDDFYTRHGIDFVPYNKLKELETTKYTFGEKILCTHVRGEIPPHVKPEIDLNLLDRWQKVLAGDLHSYENSQRNIIYPGSPYTTSFHRSKVNTGAILLDCDTLTHIWMPFQLPQLIKQTVGVHDPKPQTSFHHTIYEIEGDLHELGQLEDSDLIDKKVVKRAQETQLILDPELSLGEEVREYLTYILQLNEDAVAETLKEFYNYSDKLEL
jgi:DNA repair exonuclease SbcCD nuclease subunit